MKSKRRAIALQNHCFYALIALTLQAKSTPFASQKLCFYKQMSKLLCSKEIEKGRQWIEKSVWIGKKKDLKGNEIGS